RSAAPAGIAHACDSSHAILHATEPGCQCTSGTAGRKRAVAVAPLRSHSHSEGFALADDCLRSTPGAAAGSLVFSLRSKPIADELYLSARSVSDLHKPAPFRGCVLLPRATTWSHAAPSRREPNPFFPFA